MKLVVISCCRFDHKTKRLAIDSIRDYQSAARGSQLNPPRPIGSHPIPVFIDERLFWETLSNLIDTASRQSTRGQAFTKHDPDIIRGAAIGCAPSQSFG